MQNFPQFEINKKEGFLKIYLTDDWQHGIFESSRAPKDFKNLAKFLIGSQICGSAAALLYFQSQKNTSLTLNALISLFISIFYLSNSTKNQKDFLAKFSQSFNSKLMHFVYIAWLAIQFQSSVMGTLAFIFGIDAIIGLAILIFIFQSKQNLDKQQNFSHLDELIVDENGSANKQVKQNDRVPKILQQAKMGQKMFTKGWKFNLFNQRNQVNKQISAISVIFLQLYLSMVEIVNLDKHHCFSIMVLSYSLICMFSFFNAIYIRDFEAIQVNITPIILSIAGLIALLQNFTYPLLGMIIALIADSFFAIRFKENIDVIEYNLFEQFSMESWTQEVFKIGKNQTLMIISASFIFLQIFLTLTGMIYGEKICSLILIFYASRLIQYFLNRILFINIIQSNMTCVCLAFMGAVNIFQGNKEIFLVLSTIVLIADSLIGTAIFVEKNQNKIVKFTKKVSQRQISTGTPFRLQSGDPKEYKIHLI